jgi:heme exporter protein D
MSLAHQDRDDRIERDGGTRTHVTRRRTSIAAENGLTDHAEAEVIDERSLRVLDFSAAAVNGLIAVALLIVESLLATRFLLLAFGASKRSGFVRFIYDVSHPLMRPFSNAFALHHWDQGIIEPASLLAIFVYAVAAALLISLIRLVVPSYRERRAVVSRRTQLM